jgi:Helix-turn-helix domain
LCRVGGPVLLLSHPARQVLAPVCVGNTTRSVRVSTRSVRFMVVLSPGRDSMRRTEVLDGVRMLKFRDVFGRCEEGNLSKLEAAELLRSNERTFRRWCRDYEEEGEAGRLDRRLGNRPRNAFLLERRRKSSGSTGSGMRDLLPSTSTSTWCGPTASAGATAGPKQGCFSPAAGYETWARAMLRCALRVSLACPIHELFGAKSGHA